MAVATLVVGSLITGVAVWNLRSPVPQPLARFVVTTPPDGPLQTAVAQTDVAISPDGMRILYSGGAEVQDRQLYVRQLDEIEATPLRGTSGGSSPFFSPDGEWVGFRQDDALKKVSVLGGPPVTICEDCVPGGGLRGASWGTDDIIVFASTGSGVLLRVPAVGGEPEVLATVDPELGEILYWPEVVPNGHAVLFTVNHGGVEAVRLPTGELVSQGQGFGDIAVLDLETGEQEDTAATGADMWVLSLDGERSPELLIQTPFFERRAAVSPDSRWLAYMSNESGQEEVYVQPFPDLDGRWQISTNGGIAAVWGPDGRELFYRNGQAILRVPIDTEGPFAPGNPEVLFEGPYLPGASGFGNNYDLAPDGQRFLMVKEGDQRDETRAQIIVVQNWHEELKRLVPVN